MNWPTDCRSQWNLKLNLRHCTANSRPGLSSERVPYMKNKESNCHSNKCNIQSCAPKGPRHQAELANWPSVVVWLRPLAILQGAHRSENCISLSLFCTFMIILQNYAGNKQKLYKNIKKPIVCNIGQGKTQYRKYQRLKLGGGQSYDCSCV
jgi:hypothetical protein